MKTILSSPRSVRILIVGILLIGLMAGLVQYIQADARRPGAAGAAISIPALGIYAPIIEVSIENDSWDVSRLGVRVGHLQGTAWLGRGTHIVLVGHSTFPDGQPGIFYSLDRLQPDDRVTLSENQVERHYIVTEIRWVDYTDTSIVYQTPDEQLTLLTCDEATYDPDSGRYRQRIVVIAEPAAP